MAQTILRLDSSAKRSGSTSRALTDRILAEHPDAKVITRDLAAAALPQIDEAWVAARLVPKDERTPSEQDLLALSDTLIDELRAADTIVMGVPVYNFTIPASLKAWIDLIARPKETFAYTDSGPKGLLEGKRAIIVLASGGTKLGSDKDFASGYLRHVLGFVGITEVAFVTKGDFAEAA